MRPNKSGDLVSSHRAPEIKITVGLVDEDPTVFTQAVQHLLLFRLPIRRGRHIDVIVTARNDLVLPMLDVVHGAAAGEHEGTESEDEQRFCFHKLEVKG